MATRSLNKVILIGNLTRDPELRYTPQGTAVATFGLATNRQWTTDTGEKKEEAEFHNVVAWARLAEICGEYLKKGRQAYVEGRLSTREWEGQDGQKRRTTEVVANEVIFLGGANASAGQDTGPSAQAGSADDFNIPDDLGVEDTSSKTKSPEEAKPKTKTEKKSEEKPKGTEDDIPF